MRREFKPKYDRWFLALFLAPFLAIAVALYAFLWFNTGENSAGAQELLVPLGILGGVALLLVAFVRSTRYVLTASELIVKIGPIQIKFPYTTIQAVEPGGADKLWSHRGHLRMAFSNDNLVIRVAGRFIRAVVISPENKTEFLLLLKTYCPALAGESPAGW